ncbi:RNA 2',3'-cyclic phosphodiesterase [Persephonella sp.]
MFRKRIFIGSFIKLEEEKKFYSQLKKEFGEVTSGRWIPAENLHITYKFIGEVSEKQFLEIYQILQKEINFQREVNLVFKGFGAFPNILNPRIFFMKVEDKNGDLSYFNSLIQDKLSLLGYKKEIKPFVPHITLKRLKDVKKDQFIEKVKKFENHIFGKQNVLEINIIESILTPDGAIYKKIQI